jgi:hypothetical protein
VSPSQVQWQVVPPSEPGAKPTFVATVGHYRLQVSWAPSDSRGRNWRWSVCGPDETPRRSECSWHNRSAHRAKNLAAKAALARLAGKRPDIRPHCVLHRQT